MGRSRCRLTARVNSRDNQIGVQLLLTDDTEAEPLFYLLHDQRGAIENEIGVPIDWQPKPDKKRFVVARTWSADPTDRDDWPGQHRQLADTLEAFHEVFAPRLQRLNPDDWGPEDSRESVAEPEERIESDRV